MSSSFENGALYMTLNTRGQPGTFHWGIFLPCSGVKGWYYHATNKSGGWTLEDHRLAYKLDFLSSEAALDQALRAITDFGPISKRTGETFSCRTWMKDSLATLHDKGIVTLPADIDTLAKKAFDEATPLESAIESGTGGLTIMDGNT
ncbi:uncharacterized protein EAE97_000667 [Botrytis byssoidea]|uniref:Uncharacterized protein n=1 Tax=Botrytis byssoidea TaxID=139641 RepID=A0A9P5M4I9_9HELO|nr:uncharacterized protein EAE97_000667 [Botrytis byssoidea]KAF7955408.1 hypothetical protein EAE97_000667 [Botrytis byssoidea]